MGVSGVVAVREVDASWTGIGLTTTGSVPAACQTTEYTAGTNEVALITLNAAFDPTGNSTDFLIADIGMKVNGAAFAYATTESIFDGMSDGAATIGITKRVALTSGSKYIFGGLFYSQVGPVANSLATCHILVTIAKI